MPQTVQPSQSPFNPEIRPFNVYSLLTSLLRCYRSSCPARSLTKTAASRGRIVTTQCPLLTTHFSPPFVFIHLQIPFPTCPPTSIFIFFIFIHLQIPWRAKPLFSHLCKTPGCHPPAFQNSRCGHPTNVSSLSFSYCCKLLVVAKKVICIGISNFHTLSQKHPGWGGAVTPILGINDSTLKGWSRSKESPMRGNARRRTERIVRRPGESVSGPGRGPYVEVLFGPS